MNEYVDRLIRDWGLAISMASNLPDLFPETARAVELAVMSAKAEVERVTQKGEYERGRKDALMEAARAMCPMCREGVSQKHGTHTSNRGDCLARGVWILLEKSS